MVESSKVKGTVSQPNTDHQDDALKKFNQAIEKAEAALATSSPNALDRYKKLDDLACTLADKACYIESNRAGLLLEALEYAKQALNLVPDNHVREDGLDPSGDAAIFKNKGTISNTMRAIYSDLYWETKDSKFLDEGIKHGVQAVEFVVKHRNQYPPLLYQTLHSRRLYFLASLYKAKFDDPDPEVGGMEGDLDSAIAKQMAAANNSPDDDDAYLRLCEWCDLMVLKSGLRNDVQYIDSAITTRLEQAKPVPSNSSPPGVSNQDSDNVYQRAVHNDCEKNILLCRRWQMTRADVDFQKIIDEAGTMTSRAVEADQVSNAGNTKDVLHACTGYLTWMLTQDNSKWKKHIPSIETAIALYTELVNMIPIDTREGIEERHNPVAELTGFMQKRWEVTQKPVHGFELDAINVHSAQQGTLMSALRGGATSFVGEGTRHCSYGKSAGSGEMFWTFDPPSLPLRQQRLCFVGEITPQNWVRKRNDDGTLELGATEDDADIWQFCQGFNKKTESDPEAGEETLPAADQTDSANNVHYGQEHDAERKQEDS